MPWDVCALHRATLLIIVFFTSYALPFWYSTDAFLVVNFLVRKDLFEIACKTSSSGVYISVRCTINLGGSRSIDQLTAVCEIAGTIIVPRRSIWCNYDSQSSSHCRLFRKKSSGILIINQADLKWTLCTRNDGAPFSNRN